MAAGALVRVLVGLIKKHGLSHGIKKAKKLGFKSKDINSAVSKLGKSERLQKRKVMKQLQKEESKRMGLDDDSLYIGF